MTENTNNIVPPLNTLTKILAEVKAERNRQDLKFGFQPRCRKPPLYYILLGEEFGEIGRAIIEGDSKNYREELIQLAAVAVAAVEDYDTGKPLYSIEEVCTPIEYQIF